MKTLIVYASTYGYTEACARDLAAKLSGPADLADIGRGTPPALTGYDAVAVGGSIYMGQLSAKLKEYITANADALAARRLGLFVACGLPQNLQQDFTANFPQKLLDAAAARECFGGVLDKSKMSLGHRMITKMMESVNKKEGKAGPKPMPENISKLAGAMEA